MPIKSFSSTLKPNFNTNSTSIKNSLKCLNLASWLALGLSQDIDN